MHPSESTCDPWFKIWTRLPWCAPKIDGLPGRRRPIGPLLSSEQQVTRSWPLTRAKGLVALLTSTCSSQQFSTVPAGLSWPPREFLRACYYKPRILAAVLIYSFPWVAVQAVGRLGVGDLPLGRSNAGVQGSWAIQYVHGGTSTVRRSRVHQKNLGRINWVCRPFER